MKRTQLRRPCLICHLPTEGTYCPAHRAPGDPTKRRGARPNHDTQYGRPYRQDVANLLATAPQCRWCHKPATTGDHWPPLAIDPTNTHLVPACYKCNVTGVALQRWHETHNLNSAPT